MTKQPEKPTLTPQFCFSTGTLRAFLRLSRSSLDDSITQQLNALKTPARVGFDPSSTAQLGPRATSHLLGPRVCATFRDEILFPTWQVRTEALDYCALVAASPDPGDPEAAVRVAQTEKDRQRVVDERLDPYSGRFVPMEPRTGQLASVLRTEAAVEEVVRARTWSVLQERCGETASAWQGPFGEWRSKQWQKDLQK